jgi:hypothetical protein
VTVEPAGSPIVESTATLRASGAFRYFNAAFLAVWLAGWAIGEVVALGVFGLLIAALLAPGQGWPLSASAARWLSSGPFSLLVLFSSASTPPGWDIRIDEGADTRLTRRAQWRPVQALVLWLVTGVVSLGWITPVRTGTLGAGSIAPFVLTLLLAAGSAWLTLERSEWLAGPGRIAFRRRFGPWLFKQRFESARLEVVRSTADSEGDMEYRLVVRDETGQRTVLTAVNDEGEVVDCARWLAAHTRFPISLPGVYARYSVTDVSRR